MQRDDQEESCIKCWLPAFFSFIFLLIGILLNLRPFGLFFEKLYKDLDPGATATLIAAITGFGAIYWQSIRSHKNLMDLQNQQYKLSKQNSAETEKAIIKNTSAALNSELSHINDQINEYIEFNTALIEGLERLNVPLPQNINFSISPPKPIINQYTYQQYLKNIGKFPPEIIFKITSIYNYLLSEEKTTEINELTKPLMINSLVRNNKKLYDLKIDILFLRSHFEDDYRSRNSSKQDGNASGS